MKQFSTISATKRQNSEQSFHSQTFPHRLSHKTTWQATHERLADQDPTAQCTVHRTELAKRAFQCSAPSVCNSLPSLVTDSDSLKTFKSRRLKTILFRLAFDCSVNYTRLTSSHSRQRLWSYDLTVLSKQFLLLITIIFIIIIKLHLLFA